MDQSEIDALLAGGGKPSKKAKAAAKAPAEPPVAAAVPAPAHAPASAAPSSEPHKDGAGHVISELDTVTAVTERESNKVMDQLDQISRLVSRQQQLITDMMRHEGAQTPGVQKAIHEVMSAGKEIQDKVFEAMDLMQFQDITRQKLERIVHHLRQIHDYIVDLLGTGLKSDAERPSISHTIAQTGTTPDENKAHADSVVEAFKQQKKG
jgi:chemotaxis regulatin CheY-phosphate phosphatase CheZ